MTTTAGKRILVVEDEPIIAMTLEDMLLDMGCQIVGPAHHIEDGLTLARTALIDAAILDVNIDGGRSYAIADELARRHVPYLLATGYGPDGVNPDYAAAAVLPKPYREHEVKAALASLLT